VVVTPARELSSEAIGSALTIACSSASRGSACASASTEVEASIITVEPGDGGFLPRALRDAQLEGALEAERFGGPGHRAAVRACEQPAIGQVLEVTPHRLRGDAEPLHELIDRQDGILLEHLGQGHAALERQH
jgi:hypothetical protein